MSEIKFLKMKCTTNEYAMCADCKREFVLSLDEVATVMKNGGDKAVIQTTDAGYFHPLCGGKARTIQTGMDFDSFLRMTGIKYINVGDVSLKVSRMFFDTSEEMR